MGKTERRRKAVQCVLCEKDTYDPDRVCPPCRNAHKAGIAYLSAPASEKPDQVVMEATVNTRAYPPELPSLSRSEAEIAFSRVLRQLVGAKPATHHETGEGFKPATIVGGTEVSVHRAAERYVLTPGVKGADVAELVVTVSALAVASYRDGVKQGERFVARLAAGEISLNELQNR